MIVLVQSCLFFSLIKFNNRWLFRKIVLTVTLLKNRALNLLMKSVLDAKRGYVFEIGPGLVLMHYSGVSDCNHIQYN